MSIISRGVRKTLNNKDCFYTWVELGSIVKVGKHFANTGLINSNTGKPFVPSGIWTAAYRYILENHEEVRPIYLRIGSEIAKNDQAWEEWLVKKAMHVYYIVSSKKKFVGWLERNGFEKYDYLYAERYFGEEPKYVRKPLEKIYHEIGTQGGYTQN